MLKSLVAADVDRLLRRAFPFAARIPVHPDLLTVLGTLATMVAGLAFARSLDRTAAVAMIVAGVFDLLDGMVARAQSMTSRAGAFLDSTLDRLGDLLVFGGLAFAMAVRNDLVGLTVVLCCLGGSFLTSYSRARAEQELGRLDVGLMERAERFAFLVAGALTGYLMAALWLVAVGSGITAIQRIVVARRRLVALDAVVSDSPVHEP